MSKKLLDAIIAKDALNTVNEFNTAISKHIQTVLDNKRQEIGKNIFSEANLSSFKDLKNAVQILVNKKKLSVTKYEQQFINNSIGVELTFAEKTPSENILKQITPRGCDFEVLGLRSVLIVHERA